MFLKNKQAALALFAAPLFLIATGCAVEPGETNFSGSVSGVAVYKDGKKDENGGILVSLATTGSGQSPLTVLTSADGTYRFTDIAPGEYSLFAQAPDSVEKSARTVVSVAYQNSSAPDFLFTGTGSACGTIRLDGKNTGCSGFIVFIAGTTLMAATADDGTFCFDHVPAAQNYSFLVMRGTNTLFYRTSSVSMHRETALGTFDVTTEQIAEAAQSFIWKGALNAPPDEPQKNWAYFNRTTYTSYLWNGNSWQVLSTIFRDETAPGTVTNNIAQGKSNAAELTWENPTDDDLYGIVIICTPAGKEAPVFESTAKLPDCAVLVSPSNKKYVWSNLLAGNSYTFTFYAVDVAGNKSEPQNATCTIGQMSQGMSLNLIPNTTTRTNKPLTINVVCTTSASDVLLVKYANGIRQTDYFVMGGGIPITANNGNYFFSTTTNGTYTAYAKDSEGRQEITSIQIDTIDTTAPDAVTDMTAGYDAASGRMAVSWHKSASDDVEQQVLMYSASGQSEVAVLAADSESYAFDCNSDGSAYTITVSAIDAAANTSVPVSRTVNANIKPSVTKVTIDKTRIDSKATSRTVTISVSGFNFLSADTTVFAAQISGADRTPYPLTISSDNSAVASIVAPTKESVYTISIWYDNEIVGSAELAVVAPAQITDVLMQSGQISAGIGGSEIITVEGINLDLCKEIKMKVLNSDKVLVNNYLGNAAVQDQYTAQGKIMLPEIEGSYELQIIVDSAILFTKKIQVYGPPVITKPCQLVTAFQNCGKRIEVVFTGRNLNIPTNTISLVCNGITTDAISYEETQVTGTIVIPVVTQEKEFPVTILLNGKEIEGAEGTLSLLKTVHYFSQCNKMVTVIAAGKTITLSSKESNTLTANTSLAGYEIGAYPVTVGQWSTVQVWAEQHGYSFATQYTPDDIVPEDKEPMHGISFRDCLVWCNAYTEWTNAQNGNNALVCVYYTDSEYKTPIRNSASANYALTYYGSCDRPYCEPRNAASKGQVVLSGQMANGYRLPSAAEWEFAARGGNTSALSWTYTYSGSNTIDEVAWYANNSHAVIHSVGLKLPNSLGIFDMTGNVFEWVHDNSFSDTHQLRGGSVSSSSGDCTTANNTMTLYTYAVSETGGFRIARSN